MSLPDFSTQAALFSISSRTDLLFGATDRYRLFASKSYPLLVSARAQLEKLYCLDKGQLTKPKSCVASKRCLLCPFKPCSHSQELTPSKSSRTACACAVPMEAKSISSPAAPPP